MWVLGTKLVLPGRVAGALNLRASSPVLFVCLFVSPPFLNLENSFFSQKYIHYLLTYRLIIGAVIIAVGFVFVIFN